MKIYKNYITVVLILLILAISSFAQSKTNAFEGKWELNKTKTDIKNLPITFKNYKLFVAQSDTQIGIKNFVEGKFEPRSNNNSAQNVGRPQDGIWGGTSSANSTGSTVSANYKGSLALYSSFTPAEAAYNLDGKEVEVEIINNGNVIGEAKTKAKLEKEGMSLKITTVRKMKTMRAGQTEVIIYIREKMDILEDGTLKYVKTVELPTGRDDVTLYFNKAKEL